MKKIRETFADGILSIVKDKTNRNEEGIIVGKDYETLYLLHFHELSLRDEDFSFAKTINHKMARKVKVPLHPKLKTVKKDSIFVKIKDIVFCVFHVDFSKTVAYLYLEAI